MGLFQNRKKSPKSDRDLVSSDTIDLAVHAGMWEAPIQPSEPDNEGFGNDNSEAFETFANSETFDLDHFGTETEQLSDGETEQFNTGHGLFEPSSAKTETASTPTSFFDSSKLRRSTDELDSSEFESEQHWEASFSPVERRDAGLNSGSIPAALQGRSSEPAPSTLAHFGVTFEEATAFEEAAINVVRSDVAEEWLDEPEFSPPEVAPSVPPAPRRRRDLVDAIEAQPEFYQWEQVAPSPEPIRVGGAHAGSRAQDGRGLLPMLGLDQAASLAQISLAHKLFLAQHDPTVELDEGVRKLKARRRREVNAAYASYRLVMGR